MAQKRYRAQKTRGTQGFGYVAVDDGYIVNFTRSAGEKEIMESIQKESANEIMFHHRYPTSTPNYAEAAHPILVRHDSLKYDYYVIHNGIISNDDDLREKHFKDGFTYSTEITQNYCHGTKVLETISVFNDSEALAIELARDIDSGKHAGLEHVRGSIAFICLQADKTTGKTIKLMCGRNYGSPLKVDKVVGHYLALTSEGKGQEIAENHLFTYEYGNQAADSIPYKIGTQYYSRDYSKNYTQSYSHGASYYEGQGRGDYDDWRDHRRDATEKRVGFNLPAPKHDTSMDKLFQENEDLINIDIEEYMALVDERTDLLDILAEYKAGDPSDPIEFNEKVYYQEQLKEIDDKIKEYDAKYETRAIQAS